MFDVTENRKAGLLSHAGTITALALCCALALPAAAQTVTETVAVAEVAGQEVPAKAVSDEAGEYLYPDLLSGTLSVEGELQEDAADGSRFRRETSMNPWFAWKNQLRADHGLTIGGSWGVLWQNYSNSAIDQSNAVGSKFTFNLSYDLFNRGAANAVTFDMAIEDRRPLGTDLPPLQAGIGAGSIVPTAATFGEFDLGVTQFYIRQNLFNNKFQYTVGKIFAPNFVDAYPFFDDNRQFLSQAFSTSPTIAAALRGFGAVAAWYPGSNGFYLKPGIFTAHSSDTGSTVGDFFSKGEHFYMLEAGFSGLAQSGVPIHARGPMDSNNVHLTAWYRDPMREAGSPKAYGLAFNANRMLGDNVMWFLRAGWSEGWFSDRAVSVGMGWRPSSAPSDLFGVGVGWTRPSPTFLDSQSTAEVFYRFHVTPHFAVTPNLQLHLDPALNPNADTLWVFSLRARLSF